MQAKTKFKKTPIGEIPEDWRVVRLGEVIILKNGARPITMENGRYPLYGANGIMGYTSKYLIDQDFTIIIGRVGASGEIHLASGKIWISDNAIYSEKYDVKKVYPPYLLYLLKHKRLSKFASKTTHPIITQTFLKSFKIPLPPLSEQKKIAEILRTVDEAIEKTDLAIEKTERLKKGLMQRLLTKGIKHERFKKTEIGEIPEEWEVVRLGNEKYFTIAMGQSPPSSSYNADGQGLPFLQGKAEFGSIFPNPVLYTTKPLKIVEKGDILISVRAPVGDVNIAPFKLCIGRGLGAIRVNKENVNSFFLFYYLSYIKSRIEILGSGSTFKAIKKSDLERVEILLPPLSEQKQIAEILSTVDKKLELLRKRKEKLERIKKGLMKDLLTGRRRVKV